MAPTFSTFFVIHCQQWDLKFTSVVNYLLNHDEFCSVPFPADCGWSLCSGTCFVLQAFHKLWVGCFARYITNNSGCCSLSCCGSHFNNVLLVFGFMVVCFGLGIGFFLSLMTFFSFSHKDVSVCVNFFLKNYLVFPPLQVIKKLKSRLLKKPSSLVFFPVSLLYDCSLYSQDSTESNLIAIP